MDTAHKPSTLRKLYETFAMLNIDVIIMYVSISLIIAITFSLIYQFVFVLVFANVAAIIATYTLNIVADHAEDTVDGRAMPLNKRAVAVLCSLLLVLFVATYALQGGIEFFIFALIMSGLSIWYSFPRRARLKNIFLVKNVVPAACWTFSLCALYYLAGGRNFYSLPQVILGFGPFFVLFFAFEMMWDLPDRDGDKHAGVRTVPTVLGFTAARYVVVFLYFIAFLLMPGPINKTICALLAIFVVFVPKKTKKIGYHYVLTALVVAAWIGFLFARPLVHELLLHSATSTSIPNASVSI